MFVCYFNFSAFSLWTSFFECTAVLMLLVCHLNSSAFSLCTFFFGEPAVAACVSLQFPCFQSLNFILWRNCRFLKCLSCVTLIPLLLVFELYSLERNCSINVDHVSLQFLCFQSLNYILWRTCCLNASQVPFQSPCFQSVNFFLWRTWSLNAACVSL